MHLPDMRLAVIETIRGVVSQSASKIGTCAAYGISCEGWLKVEILEALTRRFSTDDDIEILPEHKNVDLVVAGSSERVLIELKTFPCNYGRSGKPITNFISGVVADLEKLGRRIGPGAVGIVVWVAYSIPDSTPTSWPTHLRKVETAASRTVCIEKLPLWSGHSAHMYIMEAQATCSETGVR